MTTIPPNDASRNGPASSQASEKQDQAIRETIQTILDGQLPLDGPDYGDFTPVVTRLKTALATNGLDTARRMYEVLRRNDRRLAALLETPPAPPPSLCPPLSAGAAVPPEVGADACRWLDEFIAFSKKWAPEAYDGFHEACGLWLLSTVAARRVRIPFGPGGTYTPLIIALVGRTTMHTKSTTAKIVKDILREADLSWLLGPDNTTPGKMVSDMAGKVIPTNYSDLPEEDQQRIALRAAMPGQRGWFYEEFGMHVKAILQEGGPMAAFHGLLRIMDDCPPDYEYSSLGRGDDRIDKPYLSLLVSMTPADMRRGAKRGAEMWSDGFWARFAFVTPPPDALKEGRFPEEPYVIPNSLIAPIRAWHTRLGVPKATIEEELDKKNQPTGRYRVTRDHLPEQTCTIDKDVIDAHYTYRYELRRLAAPSAEQDLDGNYGRFPAKALRFAALLASLENNHHIQLRHWARGQAIAERMRADLHSLLEQVNEPAPNQARLLEEKILREFDRRGPLTVREVAQHIKIATTKQIGDCIEGLVIVGVLQSKKSKRKTVYHLAEVA